MPEDCLSGQRRPAAGWAMTHGKRSPPRPMGSYLLKPFAALSFLSRDSMDRSGGEGSLVWTDLDGDQEASSFLRSVETSTVRSMALVAQRGSRPPRPQLGVMKACLKIPSTSIPPLDKVPA